MNTRSLKNISIAQFKEFLKNAQCKYISTNGGHEKWTRADAERPIIFQTHIDPVPEFIVRNNLRILGCSRDDFYKILSHHDETIESIKIYLDEVREKKKHRERSIKGKRKRK